MAVSEGNGGRMDVPGGRSGGAATTLPCAEARELLSGHLDEVLSPAERTALDAHLGGCPSCAAELQELREMVGTLKALPRVPVPAELHQRIRDAVKKEREAPALARVIRWAFPEPQGRMMLAAATMAGAAILVGVGVLTYGPSGPREVAMSPPASKVQALSEAEAGAPPARTAEPVAALAPPAPPPKTAVIQEGFEEQEARDAPAVAATPALPPSVDKLADLKGKAESAKDEALPQSKQLGDRERSLGYLQSGEKKRAEPPAQPQPEPEADAVVADSRVPRLSAAAEGAPEGSARTPASPPAPVASPSEAGPFAPVPPAAERPSAAEELRKRDDDLAAPRRNESEELASATEARGGAADEEATKEKGAASRVDQPKPKSGLLAEKTLLDIDTSTGWFRRQAGAGLELGRRQGGLFASLEPGTSDASGPLMRLTFPTDGWTDKLETKPSMGPATIPGAPYGPGVEYQVEVRGRKCEPDHEDGAGSDRRPLPVVDDVKAPVLHEGQTPFVASRLAGATAVFDVIVRRDGSVAHVEIAPGGNNPSGAGPEVTWAIYRWRFTPGTCDGAPVATRFRVQVKWEKR